MRLAVRGGAIAPAATCTSGVQHVSDETKQSFLEISSGTCGVVVWLEPGPESSRTICIGELSRAWYCPPASLKGSVDGQSSRVFLDESISNNMESNRTPSPAATAKQGGEEPPQPRSPPPPPPPSSLPRPRLSPARFLDHMTRFNTTHLPRMDAIVDGVGGTTLHSHEGYFSEPSNLALLEAGGALFSFSCRRGYLLPPEAAIVRAVANLSSYDDEVSENFVPPFDVDDPEDLRKYTYVVQKCSYLLGSAVSHPDDFVDADFLSTVEYHRSCQLPGTRVWTDVREPRTFRITRTIIKFLFYVTVQFRVSALGRNDLDELERVVGTRIDRGVLLERNRRSKKRPKKMDGTAKAKSVLLYTKINDGGGVLVTNMTVILHTGIPHIVAGVVDNFGSRGLGEVCETAARTRKYLKKTVASRKPAPNGAVVGTFGSGFADVSVDATHTEISTSFDCDDDGIEVASH